MHCSLMFCRIMTLGTGVIPRSLPVYFSRRDIAVNEKGPDSKQLYELSNAYTSWGCLWLNAERPT